MSGNNYSPKNLRDILTKKFTLEELRELCVELRDDPELQATTIAELDYEDLPGGDQKSAKARELVEFFRRRSMLDKLGEFVRKHRPDADIITSHTTLVGAWLDPLSEIGRIHTVAISKPEWGAHEGESASEGGPRVRHGLEELAAFADGDESGDIIYEQEGETVFISSLGELPDLLRGLMEIFRPFGEGGGSPWHAGVHSENLCFSADDAKLTKAPSYCKEMAGRVMELGVGGHILASHLAAQLLKADRKFAPLVHPVSEAAYRCHASQAIYNIYGDGFGNPQPPRTKRAARRTRMLKEFRTLVRRTRRAAEAPKWVLHDFRVPKVVNNTRPEKLELSFCTSLSYVRVRFDTDDEFQISKDNGPHANDPRRLSPKEFDCKFQQNGDYHRLVFGVGAVDLKADSCRIITINCYDDAGRLISPPLDTWVKCHRRSLLVHHLLRPYYLFKDNSWKVRVGLIAAVVLFVLVAGYRPLRLGSLAHGLKHLGESVLIRAHAPGYAARFDDPGGWVDPVEDDGHPLEERWDFPAGKWSKAEGWSPDETDLAIMMNGWGLGLPKGLGGRVFYDFNSVTRVTFYKGRKVAWAYRVQPDSREKGLSGYVFELVKNREEPFFHDRLRLDTYIYQAGQRTLVRSDDLSITQCCIEGDTIIIDVVADHYDFDFKFTLDGELLYEGNRRSDVGNQDSPVIRVNVDRKPYYRHGVFGLLGTDDGTPESPKDVRVENWVVIPLFNALDL